MIAARPDGRPLLIVATVTPLADDGARIDDEVIDQYVAFLEARGADGVFACGTTGEGVLLSIEERGQTVAAFRSATKGMLFAHAGAQTTADTVTLAAQAAERGADAVAVIAPPYFPLDADALTTHFAAAARACAPLPFYCYAFAARSGYRIPIEVVERLREEVDNLAGLKVSESPLEAVMPYLGVGLPVLIGNEPMIPAGLDGGAVGAVSGLAAAFPEEVRDALDHPSTAAGERMRNLRAAVEDGGTFIAAAKHILGRRGVPVKRDMRAPLRRLSTDEIAALERRLDALYAVA